MTLNETRYEEAIEILGREAWEDIVSAIEEQATDLVEEGEVAEDTEDWELKEIAENMWDMHVGSEIEVRLEELDIEAEEAEIVYDIATTYCHDFIRHVVRQT